MQARIPRKEHALATKADYPACPESGIAVPGVTPGKMLRRSTISRDTAKRPALPPIHLGDGARTTSKEKSTDPDRCNPLGARIARGKPSYGHAIQVIVMIMRKKNSVDGR